MARNQKIFGFFLLFVLAASFFVKTAGAQGQLVQTLPASNVSGDSANVNGYINFSPNFSVPPPAQVQYRFAFGRDAGLASADYTPYSLVGNVLAGQLIFANVNNLQAATPYYYRLEVVLPNNSVLMGDIHSFSTFGKQGGIPVANTLSATPSSDGSVVLSGRIAPMGFMPEYWFEFSFNPAMQFSGATPFETAGNVPDYVDVSQRVPGLQRDVAYYYRLAVQTLSGTTYGDVQSFVIPRVFPAPPPAAVSALPAAPHSSVSAVSQAPAPRIAAARKATSTPVSPAASVSWKNINPSASSPTELASLINLFSGLLGSIVASLFLYGLAVFLIIYILVDRKRQKQTEHTMLGKLRIVN